MRDRSSQKRPEAKVLGVKERLRGFMEEMKEKSIFVKKFSF
jgi:hypothetical protein